MSGVIIDSFNRTSGSISEAVYSYSQDIIGSYVVLHQHIADGDIPICYNGINNLRVMRNSSSAEVTLSFPDLSSDAPADVITWLTNEFNTLPWAVPVVSVVANGINESYTVTFTEAVTLKLSNSLSTISNIFGFEDLSGVAVTLDGYNLDARPQLMNVGIDEASDKLFYPYSAYSNMIISTKDEQIKNHVLTFAESVSQLRVNFYRFNAPGVICPMLINYVIIIQKVSHLANLFK